MKKESKLYLFRDRSDYIKVITSDNIFNVTGEKGSGKSFFGNMKDELDTIVVHLDPLFQPIGNKEHGDTLKVRKILIATFSDEISSSNFEKMYYKVIVNYLKEMKKESYIEGGSFLHFEDVSSLQGTIIVKRTGVFKCFFRAVKRDYANEYFMNEEIKKHGKFAKITRLYNVIKRRKKIFKSYHLVEKFIEKLENIG